MEPVSFGRFTPVVKAAKANLGLSPHDGRFSRQPLHQLQQSQAVGALLLVFNPGKKLVNAGIVLLGFQL